jgi:Protein of unknown function (DUF3891)
MLVRDAGDAWQIVLQTDHGRLAGDFARAWGEEIDHRRSLELVADRHDDGWFVWEQAPGLDSEGRPYQYTDLQVTSHIAFYRAAITAISEQDPFAGLIVSMHGAGIYRSRYGLQPSLKMKLAGEAQQLVEDFVAGEEATYAERAAALGVSEDERWHAYKLLQVWDQLSLYACLNDLAAESSEGPYSSIPSAPLGGEEVTLTLRGLGGNRVTVDPYPFAASRLELTLPRRLVAKRDWRDSDDFRVDFDAAEVEHVDFTMEAP